MSQNENKEEWKSLIADAEKGIEISKKKELSQKIIEEKGGDSHATPSEKISSIGVAGTKKCKHCAMMIPKEAKICPHCRKKLGWTMPAKIGLIIFILWAVGFMISRTHNGPTSSPPEPSASTSENRSIPLGVPLTDGGQIVKQEHPTWSNDDCNTIAKKKIHIGMTEEQVATAWGKPHRINTTTGRYGEHAQWVMQDSIHSDYLYFENGVLNSIQQSK